MLVFRQPRNNKIVIVEKKCPRLLRAKYRWQISKVGSSLPMSPKTKPKSTALPSLNTQLSTSASTQGQAQGSAAEFQTLSKARVLSSTESIMRTPDSLDCGEQQSLAVSKSP